MRPTFWQSTRVASVSRDARLVLIGLHNEADDHGRLYGSAKRLVGILFPHDDDVTHREMGAWLLELSTAGLVIRYEHAGATYLFIKGFFGEQKIDRRTASQLPPPPADLLAWPADFLAGSPEPAETAGGVPQQSGAVFPEFGSLSFPESGCSESVRLESVVPGAHAREPAHIPDDAKNAEEPDPAVVRVVDNLTAKLTANPLAHMERLGPYGEVCPKTPQEALEFPWRGRRLVEALRAEHPTWTTPELEDQMQIALNHRDTLREFGGPRFAAWDWPTRFIPKFFDWMRKAATNKFNEEAAKGRAAKAGVHVIEPSATTSTITAPLRTRYEQLRAMGHDLPPIEQWVRTEKARKAAPLEFKHEGAAPNMESLIAEARARVAKGETNEQ